MRVTFDAYVAAIRTVIEEIAGTPQPPVSQSCEDEQGTVTWQSPSGHSASVVTTLDHDAQVKDVHVFFDTFASDETWANDERGAEALGVRIALRLEIEARS